jgi:hypothetical protein
MKLPDDVKGIPVQAIECYLAGVRPGYGGERDGFWSKDSVNKFCEIIDSKQLLINVSYDDRLCLLSGIFL